MEKITKYFKHDYENDTTIEYVNTGLYSVLNCSFTSEDPDYGTDTIHFKANPAESIEKMAYDLLREVTDFLDFRDGKIEASLLNTQNDYCDYSDSTLIAIEYALTDISKDYRPRLWFSHLEDATLEIAKRIIKDGTRKFSFCESNKEEQQKYTPEEYDKNIGTGWFGIKRLGSIFDNDGCEYIIGIGYYGGGCFESAYVYDDGYCVEEAVSNLGRAICNAIIKITDMKEQSIVFITEENEEE